MSVRLTIPRLLLVILLCVAATFIVQPALFQPVAPVISRWASDGLSGAARASGNGGLSGAARPMSTASFEAYNRDSTLIEDVDNGQVRFFRRDTSAGTLFYIAAAIGPRTHLQLITADGATPGSDATGDTIWTDGQKHLARVGEMVGAPYAQQEGKELLGAFAFGFHGAERTSNEGTVVINGEVLRVNAGRGTFCLTGSDAGIGLFDAATLERCTQAVGGGPVILWQGKIANTTIVTENDVYIPFNPLNEDFTQLDWRKMIYDGTYPKTAIGIGVQSGGTRYVILAISMNMIGTDFAQQLRDMGCTDALGGDDDTSTQLVWRGQQVRPGTVREVPDALAVYSVTLP